ncbi:MAG: hypothetical protein CMP09_08455 [Yangia sp.]|nr:hypothetical protein [Salipiger sp.]
MGPDPAQEEILRNEIEGHFRPRRRLQKSDTEIVFEVFGIIDQKAGAMLTHVSVMIAANALLLTIETSPLLDLCSIILMVLFIGVALLTLRLLRFWSTDFHGPEARNLTADHSLRADMHSLKTEVFFRGRMYRLTINVTTVLTALSALVMVVSLLVLGMKAWCGS